MMLRNLFTFCLLVALGAAIGSQVIDWWRDSHFYLHAVGVRAGTECQGSLTLCTVTWMEDDAAHLVKCENGLLTLWDGEQPRERCIVNNDPAPLTISVKP